MPIDMSKVTPGKWAGVKCWNAAFSLACGTKPIAIFDNETNCDLTALLKNVMDVMERRGWGINKAGSLWCVFEDGWMRMACPTLVALYEAMLVEDERLTREGL